MKRVLLTGMSATGKSTVVKELRARGFRAIDMDEDGWSRHDEAGHQLWNEQRLQEELASSSDSLLFIAGCAENQVNFYACFTAIILLSAAREVLFERLKCRTNNPYGKHPDQLHEILRNLETIEPLLRRSATLEIDTNASLDQVVHEVINHATTRSSRGHRRT